MVAFSRYYIDFLTKLWQNVKSLFVDYIFGFFKKIFYSDPKEYIELLRAEAWESASWNSFDWIALVFVSAVNIALVVLFIIWLIQLCRRHMRFKKKEIEKDDLLQEVEILNQKVIELIDEKNKILALRVSQIGGTTIDNTPRLEAYDGQRKSSKRTATVSSNSRFTKLIEVDNLYPILSSSS